MRFCDFQCEIAKRISPYLCFATTHFLLDHFSKDDLYYHHEDKINGKRGQQITVIGQCCDSYHGHDDCEFVEVRNQFDETGFIHVSIVGEEEKKLSCFMSPKCKDLEFGSALNIKQIHYNDSIHSQR